MAHNIAELLGTPMIAYVGETPWHRLGFRMDTSDLSVAAALKAANLNWRVGLQPMYVKTGKFENTVPNRFAVVRDVDGQVLGTVARRYAPVQNSEAFGVLDEACRDFGVTIEVAGALGVGDRVWMLAKMPNSIEPVKGDRVNGYVLITTGHNGWMAREARLTSIRVVCANTLAMAKTQAEPFMSLKHTAGDNLRTAEMAKMITQFAAALKQTGDSYAKLAATKMSTKQMIAYVKQVLGVNVEDQLENTLQKKLDAILKLAMETGKGIDFAPKTAWAAFNAVTEFIDHDRTSALAPSTQAAADRSAVFGHNADVKQRALELALVAA